MGNDLKPVGEIIETDPRFKPPTRAEWRLIEAGSKIYGERPNGEDMAYMHTVLCQVGLPRRGIKGRSFMRHSGAAWLNVQAGLLDEGKGPVEQPVPYGPLPRLALAYISTFAVCHRTQAIPIGHSAAEFLRKLDMDIDGRRYTTLRRQMHALAACHIQLGYRGRTYSGVPIKTFDAWVRNRSADGQCSIWPGNLTLSTDFFESLVQAAVPLDLRALSSLKGSALAMDVYTWLAHRLWRIEGKGVALHWKVLKDQFGQEYQGKDAGRDFKKEFTKALKQVMAVYPQARVKPIKGGLLLLGSPSPIAPEFIKP